MSSNNKPLPITGPNSIEAEQQLLCCLFRDATLQGDLVGKLTEFDFYLEAHRVLFGAIKQLVVNNSVANVVTVIDLLRRQGQLDGAGGTDYISKINDLMLSVAKFDEYLLIVKRCSGMRAIIDVCSAVSKMAYSATDVAEVVAFAESQFAVLSSARSSNDLMPLWKVAMETLQEIENKYKDPNHYKGITVGYPNLDRRTNGFNGGELIILAARPSVGKSTLAMNMAENVAKENGAVAIFSLEMTNKQLVERLLASLSGIPLSQIKNGRLEGKELAFAKLGEAYKRISTMHLFGNDTSSIRPSQIYAQCRQLKKEGNLDIVFIDYIGLMASDSEYKDGNRQQEIASISRALKVMAKELDVPVVALSQVKREVETRNVGAKDESIKPVLSDLRESGAIEQDADIVMFIHRDKQNKHDLIIAKHRNGECGEFPLTFIGSQVKFVDESLTVRGDSSSDQQQQQQPMEDMVIGEASNDEFIMDTDGEFFMPEDMDMAEIDLPNETKE